MAQSEQFFKPFVTTSTSYAFSRFLNSIDSYNPFFSRRDSIGYLRSQVVLKQKVSRMMKNPLPIAHLPKLSSISKENKANALTKQITTIEYKIRITILK